MRDSGAGIGTMSFVDAQHGTFAGLGHSISDTDTGTELTLLSGEIVPVTITGCIRGAAGSPGELRGEFSAKAVGRVLANDAVRKLYRRYDRPGCAGGECAGSHTRRGGIVDDCAGNDSAAL